jgi:hypothetical protein
MITEEQELQERPLERPLVDEPPPIDWEIEDLIDGL